MPTVSIGVPVYNGEQHVGAALDSLLSQSCGDLELIVSDNASTDSTWEICEGYARRDPRVRMFRQPRNGGVAANWNFVARQARGRFFKWASASDLCAPMSIERCLEAMSDDTVVLAFGHTSFIDDGGREVSVYDKDFAVLQDRPSDRFAQISRYLRVNNAVNGLIRLDALRKTRMHRAYPHSDLVLMAELALYGRFVLLPEVLLYRRTGPEHTTGMRTAEAVDRMFRPTARRPLLFLNTRRHADALIRALASAVPAGERRKAASRGVAMHVLEPP